MWEETMWENFGDVDYLEYGGVFVRPNWPDYRTDTDFRIIYVQPFDDAEDSYLFADCYIDITDDWINREAVMECCGMTEDSFDNVQFATDCIYYYGPHEFTGGYSGERAYTRDEVVEKLKKYGIINGESE